MAPTLLSGPSLEQIIPNLSVRSLILRSTILYHFAPGLLVQEIVHWYKTLYPWGILKRGMIIRSADPGSGEFWRRHDYTIAERHRDETNPRRTYALTLRVRVGLRLPLVCANSLVALSSAHQHV